MTANNALQRTGDHRGRPVLAIDGVLAGAELATCPAAARSLGSTRCASPSYLRRSPAILASLTGCAHHISVPPDIQAEERRVFAIEDEYIAAEVSRDEATLRKLIDDRFVLNSSRGTTSGKEDLIQSVLKMNMVGQSVRERSVLIEGDIAIVFGTAVLRFASSEKGEATSTLRYTSTYVRRNGQWRMLALQMQQRASKSGAA